MQLASQLREVLSNEIVADDPETLAAHSGDKWFAAHPPEVVVLARSTGDVIKLLQFASRKKIPVTPRGGGFGYVGGCVPARGGIALSLVRMKRIKEINFTDAVAIVEPGVFTADLKAAVRAEKLFYPPDPASMKDCTIGGNVATNAGGPRCLKYGVTRNYVIGLEVALANGDILRTGGRVHKNKTGFDLIGLFVGSEGMLGVVTEITLRLLPLPPARATLSAAFGTATQAAEAVQAIFAAGFLPSALEIADHFTLEAARRDLGEKIVPEGNAHLLVDLDGQQESVRSESAAIRDLIEKRKPNALQMANGEAECEKLWALRRQFSNSLRATGLTKLNEDVVVPAQSSRRPDGIRRQTAGKTWIPDRLLRSRRGRQHSRQHHGRPLQSRRGCARKGRARPRRSFCPGAGVGRCNHRRTRNRFGKKTLVARSDERNRT